MSSYVPNFFKAYLAAALPAGETSATILLDRITTLTGESIETSDLTLLGKGIITINPEGDGNTSYPENASFTGVTALTKTLTGCKRGIDKVAAENEDYMRYHPVGTPVIISFGVHTVADIIAYIDAQTYSSRKVLVAATAGETLAAAGIGVYLKTSDNKWYKWSAAASATCENVQLGITQGAGAINGLVSGGVLIFGLDQNQSGLSTGALYVSDTAGLIATSAGTIAVIIGGTKTATEMYFNPALGQLTVNGTQTLTNKTFTGSKFRMSINTQTGDYTLVLTDESKIIQMNKASGLALTVPPNSSVAFPIGTRILVRQMGAGQLTFTPGAAVTINSSDSAYKMYKQYGVAVLIKVDTDVWALEGNLST